MVNSSVPVPSLKKQIELHESQVLRFEQLGILNTPPVTIDESLCGQKISISFARDYDKSFTKKEFPGGVYMFDIGTIIKFVKNKHNDGVQVLQVDYEEGGAIPVPLKLDDYASDIVTIPDKQYQWRLLTSLSITSDA